MTNSNMLSDVFTDRSVRRTKNGYVMDEKTVGTEYTLNRCTILLIVVAMKENARRRFLPTSRLCNYIRLEKKVLVLINRSDFWFVIRPLHDRNSNNQYLPPRNARCFTGLFAV